MYRQFFTTVLFPLVLLLCGMPRQDVFGQAGNDVHGTLVVVSPNAVRIKTKAGLVDLAISPATTVRVTGMASPIDLGIGAVVTVRGTINPATGQFDSVSAMTWHLLNRPGRPLNWANLPRNDGRLPVLAIGVISRTKPIVFTAHAKARVNLIRVQPDGRVVRTGSLAIGGRSFRLPLQAKPPGRVPPRRWIRVELGNAVHLAGKDARITAHRDRRNNRFASSLIIERIEPLANLVPAKKKK